MPVYMSKINKRDLLSLFSPKNILLFTLTTFGVVLLTILITLRVGHQQALREQRQLTSSLREDINRHLETNFSESSRALTGQQAILELFLNPDPSATRQATALLNSTREILGASLVYIQDHTGTVIASSFSESGETLYGYNYKFRPYFTESMQGRDFIYPALGVTTDQRGIYFSSPIKDQEQRVHGVAIIKSGLKSIDKILSKSANKGPAAILTGDGIVFASSEESWLFHAIKPLSPQRLTALKESSQFAGQPLTPLPFQVQNGEAFLEGKRYGVQMQGIALSDWTVITLLPRKSAFFTIALVCLAFTIPAFFFFLKVNQYINEVRYKSKIRDQNVYLKKLNREMKKEIEERKETERQLKRVSRQELQYRMLFEQSRDAISIVSADGRFLEANQAFLSMMECTKEELKATDPKDFWIDQEERRDWLKLLQEQGSIIDYQSKQQTKTGAIIDLTLTTNATISRDGATVYLTILRNITDKLEDQRKLIAAKTEAEQANRAKSNFLANMSHEIRTPMNGIMGMTNIVLDSHLQPEQRNYLEMVRSSADRLLDIINNILDFSKIEAGRLELEELEFSLRDKLNELVSLMSIKARNNKVTLSAEVADNVPDRVIGDPTRLMQILINLTNNAIKFSANGSVLIRAGEKKMVSATRTLLCFSVRDTGIGVPQEKQRAIFDSFSQADTSTTRQYGGTGLGLTISSQLCRLMGGEIGLESEESKGSLFWFTAVFTLPENIHREQEKGQGLIIGSKLSRTEIFSGIRILLAEDDHINRTLALAILKKAGLKATAVNTGVEAVEESARTEYNLILMDIQMPEMDGYKATAAIRRRQAKSGRHTPIIAMTAHAIKGDREKCLAAGMDDYVTKPINTTELYATIERHLLRRVLIADDHLSSLKQAGRIFTEAGWRVTLAENIDQCLWECENFSFDLIIVDFFMAESNLAAIAERVDRKKRMTGKFSQILATAGHVDENLQKRCAAVGIQKIITKPLTPEKVAIPTAN